MIINKKTFFEFKIGDKSEFIAFDELILFIKGKQFDSAIIHINQMELKRINKTIKPLEVRSKNVIFVDKGVCFEN